MITDTKLFATEEAANAYVQRFLINYPPQGYCSTTSKYQCSETGRWAVRTKRFSSCD